MTGRTYGELAAHAFRNNDSRMTVEIISRYKQSIGEPPHRNPDVLTQQRPGTFRNAAQTPRKAEQKAYTAQEYMDVENRYLANPALVKDADFAALLGDMRKARDEGRITP